jgi:nitrate reductase gamma subunit
MSAADVLMLVLLLILLAVGLMLLFGGRSPDPKLRLGLRGGPAARQWRF